MNAYYYFYNSVRVLSGEGAVNKVASEIRAIGGKNALLISDKVLQKLGVVDTVKKALTSGNVKVDAVYININSRPTIENINEMYQIYRANGCDCLIACGGGSVIEATKGLKLLLSTQNKNILEVRGSDVAKYNLFVPFGVVSTNTGTGCDVTRQVSIMDSENKYMMEFESLIAQPAFTILSPELTTTLPALGSAASFLDILTHCLEAFCCINDNPLSKNFALQALTILKDNYYLVMEDLQNVQPRRNIQEAQIMASLAFSNSKAGIMYAIAHAIGLKYNVEYSKALCCIMQECLKFNLSTNASKYAQLLFYISGADKYICTLPEDRPQAFIDRMSEFLLEMKKYGLPLYLEELGIKEEEIDEIAKIAYCDSAIVTNGKSVLIGDIQKILFNSLRAPQRKQVSEEVRND